VLTNWLYGVPTWAMGAVVIALTVALSLAGLVVTTRLLKFELRRRHNEFAGFNSALVGVLFAVLLAFIAISAWEDFNKAGEIAEREAAFTGDLFRDALAFPEPARTALTGAVRDYLTIVLDKEWPAMAVGQPVTIHSSDEGWAPLLRFHQTLTHIETANPLQVAVIAETLQRLNALYDARRERLVAAQARIEPTVWAVLLLGTAITIASTYLFGMESFKLHMLMTGYLAATLGLIIMLMIAFDYPFRGQIQVAPDGFERIKHHMEEAGIAFEPARGNLER
jgi:hypothetical protein